MLISRCNSFKQHLLFLVENWLELLLSCRFKENVQKHGCLCNFSCSDSHQFKWATRFTLWEWVRIFRCACWIVGSLWLLAFLRVCWDGLEFKILEDSWCISRSWIIMNVKCFTVRKIIESFSGNCWVRYSKSLSQSIPQRISWLRNVHSAPKY